MKRGSSIGAPHAVQIATGCDGQPTLPSLREALEREPKYRRHTERAGRSGPRCGVAGPGARRPRAERGNLKAPEVTQLNHRPTTKIHKEKLCDAPRLTGAMRSRGRKRWQYRKEPPCAGGSRFRSMSAGSAQKRRLANLSSQPRPQTKFTITTLMRCRRRRRTVSVAKVRRASQHASVP